MTQDFSVPRQTLDKPAFERLEEMMEVHQNFYNYTINEICGVQAELESTQRIVMATLLLLTKIEKDSTLQEIWERVVEVAVRSKVPMANGWDEHYRSFMNVIAQNEPIENTEFRSYL